VHSGELATWADSPERGYGRFSYLAQDTLTASITFVGGLQTASHGSGYVGASLTDSVIGMTIVDASGEIKHYGEGHPDLSVMTSCLGMCGIVLDVTVRVSGAGLA
jgi:FAD/FMN-containing dehydrogenase